MTRRVPVLFFLSALPFLMACGGSGPAEPVDDPEGLYTLLPCAGLELGATSGLPLSQVAIGTLPPGFSGPFAAALNAEDDEPDGFAYVRPDSTGQLYLTVPLHPETPVDGGGVSLTFTDGTRACPAVDFTILALPAAEGELAAVVQGFQEMVAAQAALFDGTPDELRAASLDSVPASLWPMALVQTLLDDPDNEESLLAVANGSLGDDALRWIDGLTALTGLREAVEAPAAAPSGAFTGGVGPARLDAQIDLLCRAEFIDTDERLDECMALAADIAASTTGLSREVANDIQSAFAQLASHNLPLASELKTVFAAMFWIIYSERELAASVLPSRFVQAEASASPHRIPEDDDGYGEVQLSVTAASIGYDMQDHILDGIAQAKALVDATGKFDFSTGTELDQVAAKLAPKIESRIRNLDIDGLRIPAEVARVVVDNPDLIDHRVMSGDAVERVDSKSFRPVEWGPATLAVRTADAAFGGASIADDVDVQVLAIQINMDPAEALLQASEQALFRVEVLNARYPGVIRLFRPEDLQGTAVLDLGPDNVHFIEYTAPATPNPAQPDLLTVEHYANVGARESGEPPRRGIATIVFPAVRITTDPPCMEFGESLDFDAEVPTIQDPDFVWTATAGDIDAQTGLFTAPGTPAVVTVRAALASNPALYDETQVIVGGCSCQLSVTLDGFAAEVNAGRFELTQSLDEVIVVGWSGDATLGTIGFGPEPLSPTNITVGATGQFQGSGSGLVNGISFISPDDLDDPTLPPLSVSIVENTGSFMEGTISGTVANIQDTSITYQFAFHFLIAADPMWSTDTRMVCRLDE